MSRKTDTAWLGPSPGKVGGLPELYPEWQAKPAVYSDTCYICRDPDYARYELPLCRACPFCGGHIAADNNICNECGRDEWELWDGEIAAREKGCPHCQSATLTVEPSNLRWAVCRACGYRFQTQKEKSSE